MSTNTAAAPSAPVPEAPAVTDGEAMSPAERDYFESRGEKSPIAANDREPVPAPYPDDTTDGATDGGSDGDDVDGEVIVDETGTPRDPKTGQFVPKSAYLRVKEQAKTSSAQLAAVAEQLIRQRERNAIFAEAMGLQNGQQQRQEAEPAKPIDPMEDIFGAYSQLAGEVKSLKEALHKTSSETQAQFEARRLQEASVMDMRSFEAKEPAFLEAYQFLTESRHRELEAYGIDNPAQRDQIVTAEARELITNALRSRKSGAETIFKLAKARGFTPKAAPSLDPEAAAQIERINKTKAASESLRGAGSTGATAAQLTPLSLAAMSEEDFSKTRSSYIGKHGRDAWNKLMGA